MKLVVGLGNPGKEYENTRHNYGFIVIDNYAQKNNLLFKSKFNGLYCEQVINNEKIILLKPQTYMNLSGSCVLSFSKYYNIEVNDILVIYDDVDFEVGKFKIKCKGSSAGHNGINDIMNKLNNKNIQRVRMGTSKNNIPLIDYVLGKFSKEDLEKISKILPITENIINDFATNDINKLMDKYNGV